MDGSKVEKYSGLCVSFAIQVSQMDLCSLTDANNSDK